MSVTECRSLSDTECLCCMFCRNYVCRIVYTSSLLLLLYYIYFSTIMYKLLYSALLHYILTCNKVTVILSILKYLYYFFHGTLFVFFSFTLNFCIITFYFVNTVLRHYLYFLCLSYTVLIMLNLQVIGK